MKVAAKRRSFSIEKGEVTLTAELDSSQSIEELASVVRVLLEVLVAAEKSIKRKAKTA